MGVRGTSKYDLELLKSLCDGKTSSHVVAEKLGCSAKYAQELMLRYDLPRLKVGSGSFLGENNHQYKTGRIIDRDGYVLMSVGEEHPYARTTKGKNHKTMLEHRYVLEKKLGRFLLPSEVVDHIDGLRLHNDPSNLRAFDKNSSHLRATISGQVPNWSPQGKAKMKLPRHLLADAELVDTHDLRKKRGDIRLQQILLAALELGIDSPFLLGTHRYLKKIDIDYSSHSKIELALAQLYQRWEFDHAL